MSQAIIDETTLSDLANVTRTILSDDIKRTPDECVNDLSGMGLAYSLDGDYIGLNLVNFRKMEFGVWDFTQTYRF